MCNWNLVIVRTASDLQRALCPFDPFTFFLALLLGGTFIQLLVSQ